MTATTEHQYDREERREQLSELASRLPALVEVTRSIPELSHLAGQYELALTEAHNLLDKGFSQEQLSALSRSIPDAFHRHKEWVPPMEKSADGRWREPNWFIALESKLQPVLDASRVLRELGYY